MDEIKRDAASPETAERDAGNREDLNGTNSGKPSAPEVPEVENGSKVQDGAVAGSAPEWMREKEELICLVQRKQADLDNFRRISRTREEEISAYGLCRFLGKLLPVIDNIDRALATAGEDGGVSQSYLQGLSMIRKQLQQLLEQEGVVEMEALGKAFDPHYHDAVMQTAEGEGEPGSVVEEFEKGYLYKDRVLRHAKVKVMQS